MAASYWTLANDLKNKVLNNKHCQQPTAKSQNGGKIMAFLKNERHKDSIIPKVIKKGVAIKVKHYSLFESITNKVGNVQGNKIIMSLSQKLLDNNVLVGDSVVCIFLHDDSEYVMSGEILDITLLYPQKVTVKIENVEILKNMRRHTRYSVSLSSNVCLKDSREVYFAVVKNLSLVGVSFTSNVEFEVNSDIVINIAVSKEQVITFYGRIIRSRQLSKFYEYGVMQTAIDELNSEELENYIANLEKEELSMMMNYLEE